MDRKHQARKMKGIRVQLNGVARIDACAVSPIFFSPSPFFSKTTQKLYRRKLFQYNQELSQQKPYRNHTETIQNPRRIYTELRSFCALAAVWPAIPALQSAQTSNPQARYKSPTDG
jgi:hypothetical protein